MQLSNKSVHQLEYKLTKITNHVNFVKHILDCQGHATKSINEAISLKKNTNVFAKLIEIVNWGDAC